MGGRVTFGTGNRWLIAAAILAGISTGAQASRVPVADEAKTPAERASALLARMTLDDKIALVHGDGFKLGVGYAGHIPANERLGIPEMHLVDGPNGVGNGSKGVTAFPAAINTAATWDVNLAGRYGKVVGGEQAGKGNNVALTPTINILRVPQWGRSFETLSEDPFLTGRMAVAHIKGIQSEGVIATAKHFVANNQETERTSVDAKISERALREVYLPAFRAAVEDAQVGAVMCAYNRINGPYACEQPWTLTTVLKDEWGFQGFVMSDWFATHSTVAAANAGLDMEMPAGKNGFAPEYFGEALKKAIENGHVTMATLDDKVRRILTSMYAAGLFDRPAASSRDANVSSDADRALARELAEQGMVLLKNDSGVLPLGASVKSLAIIGDAAGEHAKLTGGGSAAVIPSRIRTPVEGIAARAGEGIKVTFAQGTAGVEALPAMPSEWLTPPSGEGHGLEASYFASADRSAKPIVTRVEASPGVKLGPPPVPGLQPGWTVVWRGALHPSASGLFRFSLEGGGFSRLTLDGRVVVSNRSEFGSVSHGIAALTAGKAVPIEVEFRQAGYAFGASLSVGALAPNPEMLGEAVSAAKSADVAVVFVNDVITEGSDRTTLDLPGDQDALIEAVAAANPRTVVVLNTGGPVLMPWLGKVAGVIEAWYAGQEYGDAIAAVLFGDVSPSGKLPVTFPASEDQGVASSPARFPGDGKEVLYDEGLLVGYRWFDAHHETPLFPFGFGLSYTTFKYDKLEVTPTMVDGKPQVRIQASILNVGSREGAEVAQVYLEYPTVAAEPPRVLKGFEKVTLKAGETGKVNIVLGERELSFWNEAAKKWEVAPGAYKVLLGGSSRDVRLDGTFTIRP